MVKCWQLRCSPIGIRYRRSVLFLPRIYHSQGWQFQWLLVFAGRRASIGKPRISSDCTASLVTSHHMTISHDRTFGLRKGRPSRPCGQQYQLTNVISPRWLRSAHSYTWVACRTSVFFAGLTALQASAFTCKSEVIRSILQLKSTWLEFCSYLNSSVEHISHSDHAVLKANEQGKNQKSD